MRFPARFGLLSLVLAAAACATIDQHEKVSGWPELRVVEHRIPDGALRKHCSKYVAFGMLPEACSEFYFDRGECHVWFNADYPPQPYVVKHELLHCQGYDHPGDHNLRDILARYEAQKRARTQAAAAEPAL
jgi:hypothetical protein